MRVRLSNVFGAGPLAIRSAHVALRSTGAAIAAGSDRTLTFNGLPSTTIPPGALAVSDPVYLQVPTSATSRSASTSRATRSRRPSRPEGWQTTYVSAEGHFQRSRQPALGDHHPVVYFLTGVEVDAASNTRAIVTLGDSITDGVQFHCGRQQTLAESSAERLHAQKGGSKVAVLNAGITGNRLLYDMDGSNALARLDRDVLVQSGARYLIVLLGIYDIGFPAP